MSEKEYTSFLLQQVEEFFIREIDPSLVAAVIMEPVQGESGFIIPDQAFVEGIYDLCKTHGMLFIADEIQTRSEEHTSELQSRFDLVCRLLLEKKKKTE